ncbi:MAG TPA: exodeoxyribonuclease VII small subunit [Candidatus Cybelea sp.]|jgi:exodeoxyribonuclease VII small subunit|nr:exodeoxyribonuclease VII small subunit [Candidatus Cybelea sp.]
MSKVPDPNGFEAKLDRIDAIVNLLQNGQPTLEESIALFKEGKGLARECEALLKSAQSQVDEAMAEPPAPPRSANGGEGGGELPF